MPLSLPVERTNLDRQSANAIRNAIIHGDLELGSLHKETDLAEQLGLSRSTTRTALKLLELEGLVTQQRWGGGWQIFSPSAQDAIDLYALRGCLEGLAAYTVASAKVPQSLEAIRQRYEDIRKAGEAQDMSSTSLADHAFHWQIVMEARNPRLQDQYARLQQHIQIYVGTANKLRQSFRDILQDHDEILRFILEGNAGEAEFAAREHSRLAGLMIARGLEQKPL